MKILGDTQIEQRTISVPIGKDADGKLRELIVRPVKFGTLMEIDRDIPKPLAPSTGIKKKDTQSGQALRRNGQYVMCRDEQDDGHVMALSFREMAVNVAVVCASVGDQIQGLREKNSELSWQQHWLLVLDDFQDVGIDQGIFTTLVQATTTLSEPMNNLELLLMRTALGTETETDAVTDDKVKDAVKAQEKAEAQGKA